ncbi:arylsulfatase K isoform X2 [Eucyclogobius newberryi]|uniref:arylsulfatase K isoform X2 n=1 Tax=Eucyclogobius newberryi TaxID=166745 RepID=UPI003B594310
MPIRFAVTLLLFFQTHHLRFCHVNNRPNIVMVMSDAFDGRLTFNNQVVKLPYIKYLKELGTTFLNAYTNSPICCPSRAAMWSGQFVHRTESWNNFKCLEANSTTWMDLLKDSGYTTKMIGKLDYTSGSHSVSNRVEAWTRDAKLLLSQEGRPVIDLVGNMSTVEIQKTDWQNTRAAKQWIIRNSSSNQPFALYLGLNLPHPYKSESLGPTAGASTFRTSPFWLSKVSSDLIAVPKWLSLSDMHPVDYYSTVTKNCSGVFTKEEIISIRAFYYAMCAETDDMLGEIIASLRETGVLNNTVLIFTADHGELAMEHRQFYKMSMFEGSVHIPLLFMGPGIKSGLLVEQHVSLVDLYPSVLNIADISVPANLSGYSLLPLMSKSKDLLKHQHPHWIFSEYHGCNANASTYMLIIGHWKYITYSDGQQVPPQLFDLSQDPEELHNVILKFPDVRAQVDKVLCSIVSYPLVSARVHQYNKKAFTSWRNSLGGNYSQVIANLRWHVDWQKDPVANEKVIDRWLYGLN